MSAAAEWRFNSNHGGNPSEPDLIPGPRLPIDTHQSTDAKQISITQYYLPPPSSWHSHPSAAMFTSPPVKTIKTIVIMMENAYAALRGCFQGKHSNFHNVVHNYGWGVWNSEPVSPKLWDYSFSYFWSHFMQNLWFRGNKLSRGNRLSWRSLCCFSVLNVTI